MSDFRSFTEKILVTPPAVKSTDSEALSYKVFLIHLFLFQTQRYSGLRYSQEDKPIFASYRQGRSKLGEMCDSSADCHRERRRLKDGKPRQTALIACTQCHEYHGRTAVYTECESQRVRVSRLDETSGRGCSYQIRWRKSHITN